MAGKAKEFRYAIGLDRTGRVTADGHLVLAGLVRCTLQSLRFHAAPLEIDFVADGSATAVITRREDDGRYGFVEIDVKLDLELDPVPPGEELAALLAKAERDCFVGASLKPSPSYSWRVNGKEVG